MKTTYDYIISEWVSDGCSSDLRRILLGVAEKEVRRVGGHVFRRGVCAFERARGVRADEQCARAGMRERRVHRLDRIDRRGDEGPGREAVARIDGIVDDPCEPRREIGADKIGRAHV